MSNNNCNSFGTENQVKKLEMIIKKSKSEGWTIVKILQKLQAVYGYLPQNIIEYVSRKLNLSEAEVYSVISFYAEFSLNPKGKFPISVCLGTACYVNGAGLIFEKICTILGIKEGQTTSDGKFSIDQTRCIGCCGMAPVLTIGEDVYGNVKLNDIENILKKYMG